MKTGLVLEGGGMRGLYTAGILDVFMEEGLTFDGVIGVSAGAIHGCSYVSGQAGRSIRYYKEYCRDPRFMSFRSLITTGSFVGNDFCYRELPDTLDPYDYEAFRQSPTQFYMVCSNLETGDPEYIHVTDMKEEMPYLCASASLPYFSRPVEFDGKKLLDGGCTDSIPLGAFRRMGYEKNVVILTRPAGYMKKEEGRLLQELFYHRYPQFIRALRTRHLRYNRTVRTIEELARQGKIFVIRPAENLDIGRLERDPAAIERVYETGVREARAVLEELSEWVEG
ncbi:MAG: patatin family protein [Lachnospiraceae bacterium]|nr:patatin family protein [Lachnospiraceae bacterium]